MQNTNITQTSSPLIIAVIDQLEYNVNILNNSIEWR